MTRLWTVSREVRLEARNGLLAKEKRLTRLGTSWPPSAGLCSG